MASRWLCFTLLLVGHAGPIAAQGTDSPSSAPQRVDFESHVRPILAANCVQCHARGQRKGGFSIETRQSLIEGGESGPAVQVGNGKQSLLIELVAGLDESRIMPQKGNRLSDRDVGILRTWIDQGLPWPDRFSFGFPRAAIEPRRPKLPQLTEPDASNPIDRLLAPYYRQHAVTPGKLVADRAFMRRAYLDLVGLLPAPADLDSFEQDRSPGKRAQLVQKLLGDRQAYTEHWLTFWNDALRNSYHGTGYIDGGRQQITAWLYRSLYDNKPYDQFVRELISPVPGSDGFVKGIVWRGVVNASQVPPMQAAQNVAQVFLGTNLKCASCHDSFVNYWKLKDAYALAGAFADGPLEMNQCDRPTGEIAEPAFVFPKLGKIDPAATRIERQRQLAELVASPQNGRLARTIVNRLWAWFFGRGLIEPVDDMDQPAWHPDLLDWLAADFVDHGFDLKHTMALIGTSRAYQTESVGVAEAGGLEQWVFRGPLVRRMTAEQFMDALASVTRFQRPAAPPMIEIDGRSQGGQLTAAANIVDSSMNQPDAAAICQQSARWVWNHPQARDKDPVNRIFFRSQWVIAERPHRVACVAAGDNEFTIFVNGTKIGSHANRQRPASFDIANHLVAGTNTIAVEAVLGPDAKTGGQDVKEKAAGFLFFAAGFANSKDSHRRLFQLPAWTYQTDEKWRWSAEQADGWERPEYEPQGWQAVVELGKERIEPGRLAESLAAAVRRQTPSGTIRAALFDEDPLIRALGRPNREQVVTRRESIATTLQALELSNGLTLDSILKHGADHWLQQHRSASELANELFTVAVGRQMDRAELEAAVEIIGSTPTPESVADLLWSIVMLPEFQMVY